MKLDSKYSEWLIELIRLNSDKCNFEVANVCNTNLFSNNIQQIISKKNGVLYWNYLFSVPFFLFKNLLSLCKEFLFLLKLWTLRDSSRINSKNVQYKLKLFIDIYIPQYAVYDGIWYDRMYKNAFANLERHDIGYVLTIDYIDGLFNLDKIAKNCPGNLIFPVDFLSPIDLIKIYFDFLKQCNVSLPRGLLSPDVDRSVKLNYIENRYRRSVLLGILNKRFIKNVALKIKFDTFILWHENRCQDRGFISGLRNFANEVKIVAYQGYFVCRNTYNGYFPNISDILLKTTPSALYVDGRINFEIALSCVKNTEIKLGPSLRFKPVKRNAINSKARSVLVLLPMDDHLSYRLIEFTMRSINDDHRLILRPHPLSPGMKFLRLQNSGASNQMVLSSKDLIDDFEDAFIAIGSNTSALIECYTYGIPCVGLKLNGDFENIFNTEVAPHQYNLDEHSSCLEIIKKYANMDEDERVETVRTIQKFSSSNYLTEFSDEILNEMIK